MNIRVEGKFDAIRITIEGVLHLHVQRSKLLGVQSWVQSRTGHFLIEYTSQGGVVLCEYDSREKWETILSQLADVL